MTEQQWSEFLDKLDFVQLTGRWSLLPLHWLDGDFPEQSSELSRDLVSGLMEIRDQHQGAERDQEVATLCQEYRSRLAGHSIALDSRLSPPGSRVSLSYLDPQNLGQGDCLITVGSWDRVGYLVAKAAHPEEEPVENVGENPVRREPGQLNYRHLLLFPDKGTPSPRAFRSLCEKTLKQARGLGARHISVTHLHLPQTGLADRFAAAELVSALRQMLRESPGTSVDIRVFDHRNFEDYRHWFESLKELSKATDTADRGVESETPMGEDAAFEVGDTLRNFARRSSDLASEATASVSRWFSQSRPEELAPAPWGGFSFSQQRVLNQLYLKRLVGIDETFLDPERDDLSDHYLRCLLRTVNLEVNQNQDLEELRSEINEALESLNPSHPMRRYFQLLQVRLSKDLDSALRQEMIQTAQAWDDRCLLKYLSASQEDTLSVGANLARPPVHPGGSRPSLS